jgi:TolB protein
VLYLVSPQGARDALYRWPAGQAQWHLLDWSGDKTRALFVGPTTSIVGQLVLATGKFTSFKLPSGTQPISYSRPDGTAILAAQAGSTDKILRYDLNGQLEKTLVSGPQNSASVAVYSPNGATLAVNGAKALELVTNNGVLARALPVPGNPTCQPVRWWNASTVLASCLAPDSSSSRLWLVPISGASPTALTAQRNGKGPDLGDIDAWQLPSGTYLQATGACGVIFIAKQASNGSAAAVNVPQTTGNDNQIVTALGSRLLVRAQTSCEESTSLVWFTPATNAVQMLIRAPSGTQGVIAAVPYNRGS